MNNFKLNSPVSDVTVGADPEVFVTTPTGVVYPVCGMIGGTKEEPLPVPYGALQEDNIMAEFNIDPASTCEQFVHNIQQVYQTLTDRLSVSGVTPAIIASADVLPELLDLFPQSRVMGCEPDYNAYTRSINPTPTPDTTLRTCAGHVHLGFDYEAENPFELACELTKRLDYTIGLWSVLHDTDTERKKKYGKAGAFRPKSYGVEYRVPSNFWLKTPEFMAEVFNRARQAYQMLLDSTPIPSHLDIETAINTHDPVMCEQLLSA